MSVGADMRTSNYSNNNNNRTSRGSVGFAGLLTILLIALKLCGIISWSWIWIFAPIWIHLGASVLAFIIVIVLLNRMK